MKPNGQKTDTDFDGRGTDKPSAFANPGVWRFLMASAETDYLFAAQSGERSALYRTKSQMDSGGELSA